MVFVTTDAAIEPIQECSLPSIVSTLPLFKGNAEAVWATKNRTSAKTGTFMISADLMHALLSL